MDLRGGGTWYDNEGGRHWQSLYPYDDDPTTVKLFSNIANNVNNPSGEISFQGSLSPILLTRTGIRGIGWNLTADTYAFAGAPGVEGTTPAVPEPATMLLLGLGLMGLAGVRRKIQK